MNIVKSYRVAPDVVHLPQCSECQLLVEKVVSFGGKTLCEDCATEALALLRLPDERYAIEELQP